MEKREIIIDLLGSDRGPEEMLEGARMVLETFPGVSVVLSGPRALIEAAALPEGRYRILEADKTVTNLDNPIEAFYSKEPVSVFKALEEASRCDNVIGVISAGNTGALFAGAIRYLLADKTVPLAHRTVKKATKKTQALDVIMQTDLRAVAPNEITPDNVPAVVDLPEELKAPIRKNQVLGKVTYSVDGFVYTTDLVALHDVVKKPYWLYNLLVVFALFVIFVAVLTVYLKQKRKRKRKRR